MSEHPKLKDQIIDFLKRELVGPDPVAPNIQENGEEILLHDGPTLRYGAGILFPQLTVNIEGDREDDPDLPEPSEIPLSETESLPAPEQTIEGNLSLVEDSETEEPVSLANAFKPAAMGLSFLAEIGNNDLIVDVSAAVYKKETFKTETRDTERYLREPLKFSVSLKPEDIVSDSTISREIGLHLESGNPSGLKIVVVSRPEEAAGNGSIRRLLTVSLVNTHQSDTSQVKKELCFFQVEFTVRSSDQSPCFIEYPEKKGETLDEEERSMRLLYRHRKTFAMGHGCAGEWEEFGDKASMVKTSVIPTYEVKPIIPPKLDSLPLSMLSLGTLENDSDILAIVEELCNKYEVWINLQRETAASLEPELLDAATRHLEQCNQCLIRMRTGVATLRESPRAMRAFRLMNKAMLLQQLRYSMPLREWAQKAGEIERLPDAEEPDCNNPPSGKGEWFPFQLAFILMNIACLTDPENQDRITADLIWFPTGGGKTEAYLGLTAFTIFARRLLDPKNIGVVVLMRYTLRLLTAQQFQRAASLICACESLRKENEPELGLDRISIGLWVGGDLTPNKRTEATNLHKKLSANQISENPFVVLKCPWCGAQMGRTESGTLKGYEQTRNPATIKFVCPDTTCLFSARTYPLPLYVIDEDIYEEKPSLLIGTVDKFAMITWRPEVRGIFGRDDSRISPPELVIQDELHLISGPLGSMVGHYETVIDELCTDFSKSPPRPAKIVASTATIRRAEEQVSALFSRPVFQFPPQALQAGESFFATEDRNSPGRTYVGVHATALSSPIISQVRTFGTLLQAIMSAKVEDETERDAYFTLLGYFNSLRELGHAASLVSVEIPEFLTTSLWSRKSTPFDQRRKIRNYQELTSRMESSKITESLQFLERKYPKKEDGDNPVDVCLATNMISVGLDVPRLGLMVVANQPKSTSEYIQATSRVGRSRSSSGIVVTLYNTSRPRDRSHYEKFRTYHSTLYKQVEPTSVTPWAIPVRKRALHALVVALVRLLGNEEEAASPNPFPDDRLIERVLDTIRERVASTDSKEEENVINEAREFLDDWRRMGPFTYGGWGYSDAPAPLIYPAGTIPLDSWENRARQAPSSMRNVDVSCQIGLLRQYPKPELVETTEETD